MKQTRKPRPDLTKEELERLERFGSIEFKSAGATRQRRQDFIRRLRHAGWMAVPAAIGATPVVPPLKRPQAVVGATAQGLTTTNPYGRVSDG